MQLQNFDVDAFLADYWQKRPLLIKNPWANWANPVDPDVLAGLACEGDVESRIVSNTRSNWALEHGPFEAGRFGELGSTSWTLLVQAVDQYIPEVTALLDAFRFIPNWRIDDVMVSYAAEGGGVGPHFDQYDVFLIQGLGKRRWQLGGLCDETTALLPHDDLRLLAEFEAKDEWLLEPGDMLYLPPGFAHNGIAASADCMTYSVGFRAPSVRELLSDYCDHLLDHLPDDKRYADPDLQIQQEPGEILPAALNRLQAMVAEQLLDREAFASWFGQHSSMPKYPDMDWRPEQELDSARLRGQLVSGAALTCNPASRFSYIGSGAEGLTLFADGQSFDCSAEISGLAQHICRHAVIGTAQIQSDAALALILQLYNQGSLIFD